MWCRLPLLQVVSSGIATPGLSSCSKKENFFQPRPIAIPPELLWLPNSSVRATFQGHRPTQSYSKNGYDRDDLEFCLGFLACLQKLKRLLFNVENMPFYISRPSYTARLEMQTSTEVDVHDDVESQFKLADRSSHLRDIQRVSIFISVHLQDI